MEPLLIETLERLNAAKICCRSRKIHDTRCHTVVSNVKFHFVHFYSAQMLADSSSYLGVTLDLAHFGVTCVYYKPYTGTDEKAREDIKLST